jgi:hypothetical protein
MATKNPFDEIRLTAGGQDKSYQWYRQQIENLGKKIPSSQVKNQILKDSKLTTNIMPGGMYLFYYDPKHKDTLPYYDRFPLILPFRKVQGGFYGINLHYLPYLLRFKILRALSDYTINKSDDTRIRLSWKLLESLSRLEPAKHAVKHYLNDHVRSRFYKIDYVDWITASQLPIEGFVGAQKTKVWRDTVNKMNAHPAP